ncbi:MAG TPA: glycosyltransferase [Verrucomicrobiae bacterium]|nr:glycosyltransferase [Verrucomicrobiae bacterium]
MKILFDCPLPFALAHGGRQIQIESTLAALRGLDLELEPFRWWDGDQRGDLIHFFGAPPAEYLHMAATANIPVVATQLFTETCNRSDARLRLQGSIVRLAFALPFGRGLKQQLTWHSYRRCDHHVVGLDAERQVLKTVYGVPDERISIVPLGLSENFLRAGPGARGENHLICTGTITARKNCVELAEMARAAQVPILFVGKPYAETEPYWQRFKSLIDGKYVKHHQFVAGELEMIPLLQRARGFVLMSRYENWCLSAHEAAACGLPLLVQDQKWSRERFGREARYFANIGSSPDNVKILRQFWESAPSLPAPKVPLLSWHDVAVRLRAVYQEVIARTRAVASA